MSEKKLVINSGGDEKYVDKGFVHKTRRILTNPVDSFYHGMGGLVVDRRGTVRVVSSDHKVGEDISYFEQNRLVSLRSRKGLHREVSQKIIFDHQELPEIMRGLVSKLRKDDLEVLRKQVPKSDKKSQEQKLNRLQKFLKAFIN